MCTRDVAGLKKLRIWKIQKTIGTTYAGVIEGTRQYILLLVLFCYILRYAFTLNFKNKCNFDVWEISVYKAVYVATHQWHHVVFLLGAAENRKKVSKIKTFIWINLRIFTLQLHKFVNVTKYFFYSKNQSIFKKKLKVKSTFS